ncbi:MAG: radical SAM protein [Nitrospirae bacterium]|nr:radical SAM protein [Nitrospirota bacterium]
MGNVIMEYTPYIVSWNITKRCNLTCGHCYMDAGLPEEPELPTNECMSLIDSLAAMNKDMMLIITGGEPMIRTDIYELIGHAAAAGFITVLGTNGTLIDSESVKRLKDAGLRGAGISIDSPGPSEHDSFRGSGGAWARSIAALKLLRDVGIETQLDVTVMDSNCADLERFIELGVELGAKAVNFFFLVCTGRAMKTLISTANYDSALKKIVDFSKSEKRLMARARCAPHIYRIMHEGGAHIQPGSRGCLAGRSYMRVDPYGGVTACPYMPDTLGSVKSTPIAEIWNNSQKLATLREGRYEGRCGHCEYTEVCGGCRARALAEKGGFMDEDPLCTYEPAHGAKTLVVDTGEIKSDLQWEDAAKERIKAVPAFVRKMVIGAIEKAAREKGATVITTELLDEVKKRGPTGGHKR